MSEPNFTELLNRALDGALTEDDEARFLEMLRCSAEWRKAYIDAVRLEAAMERWGSRQLSAVASNFSVDLVNRLLDEEVASSLVCQPEGAGRPTAGRSARYSRLGVCVAAAAVLLIAGLVWQLRRSEPGGGDSQLVAQGRSSVDGGVSESSNRPVVARVLAADESVRWCEGMEPSDFLFRLRGGDVVGLAAGRIRIEFAGGAFVALDGAAELEILGACSARLISGRAVGRAADGNFEILTPAAKVVDVGTSFAVAVGDQGATDVSVFEGEVHVHHVRAGGVEVLRNGMTVSLNPGGRVLSRGTVDGGMVSDEDWSYRGDATQASVAISLVELLGGMDRGNDVTTAASIDPIRGHWGEPPWLEERMASPQFGDTQFTRTDWHPFVDGVFVPRANAREMPIDSLGHVVFLPANSGATIGSIWGRCYVEEGVEIDLEGAVGHDAVGEGSLAALFELIRESRSALMGLHANVGITFDLNEVRRRLGCELEMLRGDVMYLGASDDGNLGRRRRTADLRVYVDGKLLYSRIGFALSDGAADLSIPLNDSDRFMTIVATDGNGDHSLDEVVLVDPRLILLAGQRLSGEMAGHFSVLEN